MQGAAMFGGMQMRPVSKCMGMLARPRHIFGRMRRGQGETNGVLAN